MTSPEERARRERAARLLGDVAPTITRDEMPDDWREADTSNDADLRRNRPPHHGD